MIYFICKHERKGSYEMPLIMDKNGSQIYFSIITVYNN